MDFHAVFDHFHQKYSLIVLSCSKIMYGGIILQRKQKSTWCHMSLSFKHCILYIIQLKKYYNWLILIKLISNISAIRVKKKRSASICILKYKQLCSSNRLLSLPRIECGHLDFLSKALSARATRRLKKVKKPIFNHVSRSTLTNLQTVK